MSKITDDRVDELEVEVKRWKAEAKFHKTASLASRERFNKTDGLLTTMTNVANDYKNELKASREEVKNWREQCENVADEYLRVESELESSRERIVEQDKAIELANKTYKLTMKDLTLGEQLIAPTDKEPRKRNHEGDMQPNCNEADTKEEG